jgi:hypothetical protein
VSVGAHARVLAVKSECNTRLLLRSGVDAFESCANLFEGKRLAKSEVKIFREAVVGKIAALESRTSFERKHRPQIRFCERV